MYRLSSKVSQLQVELSQNGMATQRYFLVKEKTIDVSMKPRNHVRKFECSLKIILIPFGKWSNQVHPRALEFSHSTQLSTVTLFTFVFSLGIQLSISLFFVTSVACKDNLKIGSKGNFLMSPLCNLKSLVTPAGIIEWVSEIKRISVGRIAKVSKNK